MPRRSGRSLSDALFGALRRIAMPWPVHNIGVRIRSCVAVMRAWLRKSLAQRFAADGVRVNVVCPGLADTPMKMGFTGRSGDPVEAAANQDRLLASVPMGRLCKAEEVAHAVLWLASDEASFVTGVALPIDGGFIAR